MFNLVQRLDFWLHVAEASECPVCVFGLEEQEKPSYSDRVKSCQRKPLGGMQETCPPICSSFCPCVSWLARLLPLLSLHLERLEVCQDEGLF